VRIGKPYLSFALLHSLAVLMELRNQRDKLELLAMFKPQ